MKTINYTKLFFLIILMFTLSFSNAQEFGVTKQEVNKITNTKHNVQVWEVLPEYTKNAEYEIRIKHAVTGKTGSFYIIAWADTNNDGLPDTEIGRSKLKTASKDGEWSSWSFNSDYDRIYVGNTWNTSDEMMYYQIGGTVDGYNGLSNTVFFSRTYNGKPTQSVSPRFTNVKVRFVK